MKKLLIFLGILLLIPGCSSNNKQHDSQTNSNSGESSDVINDKARKYAITHDNFWEHYHYDVSWSSSIWTDYNVSPYVTTYTTNLTITITQLRSGFVTYSGNSNVDFVFAWTYKDAQSVEKNQSLRIFVPFVAKEYEQTFVYKKTFTTSHEYGDNNYRVYSKIPYYSSSNPSTNPSLFKKDAFDSTIVATYYDYGISGDRNLCYTSYEINIVNYMYYLKVLEEYSGTYIYPIDTSDLYDYRISLTIGGQKITIRRDGYYYFNKTLDDKTITALSGYIDAYPGRII